jgi:ABC-type nitrate/sulfonate/bicarbonate transport system permease component
MCFQRDSRKDQIIVLLFIATTVGLLVWAGVRRLLEKRAGRWARPAEGEYTAVDGQ